MSKSIKLSKKYGLNPTIPMCFFCGEDKNEVALLGHIGDGRKKEDFEAPMHCILDYEPCDKCKEKMNLGVTLIGVSDFPISDGQPPISRNHYPTGRFAVVNPSALNIECEAGQKVLVDDEVLSNMLA